jgi:undecaprenyl-diphosphatase
MTSIEALLLGLVQGLSEFIPVSSSGHLVLAEKLFQTGQDSFVFDTMLNIGTLAALAIYFRRELIALMSGARKPGPQRQQLKLLALATIPGVVVGILFQDIVETRLRSGYVVAVMLVAVALVMLAVENRPSRVGRVVVSRTDSIIVGLAQVLAFLPGASRSGVTITAGIARGLSRQTAATFSFFLALPILGGGVLKVLLDDGVISQISQDLPLYGIGIAASFASGYLAVAFLLRYLKNHSLRVFAYYRIALAAIIICVLIAT